MAEENYYHLIQMQEPLFIDLTKENASLQVFPSKPFVSSREANWSKIQVESFLLPAYQAPEHLPKQNAIVIADQPVKMVQRLLGDEIRDESIQTGQIVISPANIPHSACWDEEISFTVFSVEPEYITHIAYESINPDRVELLHHFAQYDLLIYGMAQTFKSLLQSQHSVSQIYIDSLTVCLATHLLYNYCSIKHQLKENAHALSSADLQLVMDYIENYIDKKKLGLMELSNLVGMSESYFGRLFKASTGVCPAQHIIKRRVEKATYLVENTNLSLGEIAQRTGFSNQSHFSSTFSDHLSVSPSQYRKMHQGKRIKIYI
jgi:AraC family transcriptional regulator